MKIITVGRKMDVSDDLKLLFEKKLSKLDKFFKDDAVGYVTLSRKHNKEILELTISSGGTLYRCEEEDATFQNALDTAVDSIIRQIRKNKTRLEKRLREGAFVRAMDEPEEVVAEEQDFIIRTKEFVIKPMTAEEAILQMNLLGHQFFVFENAENGKTNVVYKQNSGQYGLIVPQDK